MPASTISIQNTVSAILPYVGQRPLTGVGGVPNEPALTIANRVRAFITQAPFKWRWNRTKLTFTTTAATQDYAVVVTDFGWLEAAAISGSDGIHQLQYKQTLSEESSGRRPDYIADWLDDGAGNLTFRLSPVPDGVYTVTITYQRRSIPLASLDKLWGLPDEHIELFTALFQAYAWLYTDDARGPGMLEQSIRMIIAANNQLTDAEKNIFLEGWIRDQVQMQTALMKAQAGKGK